MKSPQNYHLAVTAAFGPSAEASVIPPSFMLNGTYKIIDSFEEGKVKAVVGEDVFQAADGGSYFISHEIGFSYDGLNVLWLWPREIDAVISVLQDAKKLAEERVTRFYSEDLSPQMI